MRNCKQNSQRSLHNASKHFVEEGSNTSCKLQHLALVSLKFRSQKVSHKVSSGKFVFKNRRHFYLKGIKVTFGKQAKTRIVRNLLLCGVLMILETHR